MRRKMRRKTAPFLCSLMILLVPCISASASQPTPPSSQETMANGVEADVISQNPVDPAATTAEESNDSIMLIETESAIDAEGNVTMTFNTAEDLVLPVTMTMKGSEGALSMTVSRSGQEIKIKPDTYDIAKAVDGNGKKLPSGAELTIPKEGGIIYLDFNKPDVGENTVIDFLKTNCWFLVIAAILVFLYRNFFHQ